MPQELSKATDNIYLNRYVLFHLMDGTIITSEQINWQSVNVHRIKMLELVIRNKRYRIVKAELPSGFVEFIHFRTKGMTFILNTKTGMSEPQELNSWSIGWSDGVNEYLMEIDLSTGDMIGSYTLPIERGREVESHYHPQSLIKERGPR